MGFEWRASAFLHFKFCRKKEKKAEANKSKIKPMNETIGCRTEQIKQKLKRRQKAETKFPPFVNIKPMINRDIQKCFLRQFPPFWNFFFAAKFRLN